MVPCSAKKSTDTQPTGLSSASVTTADSSAVASPSPKRRSGVTDTFTNAATPEDPGRINSTESKIPPVGSAEPEIPLLSARILILIPALLAGYTSVVLAMPSTVPTGLEITPIEGAVLK